MSLEEILQEFGCKKPFDRFGQLTKSGEKAMEKLIKVVDGLYDIGAITDKPDDIESYCYEIVRLGF